MIDRWPSLYVVLITAHFQEVDLLQPKVILGVSTIAATSLSSSLNSGTTNLGITNALLAMSCDKDYKETHLSISSSGKLATRCRLSCSLNLRCGLLGSINLTITDLIVSNLQSVCWKFHN